MIIHFANFDFISLYSWGRGLYGVLGNGLNEYSLVPKLNESVEGIKEKNEDPTSILKIESADEFTLMLMNDGTLNSWGKND